MPCLGDCTGATHECLSRESTAGITSMLRKHNIEFDPEYLFDYEVIG